MKAESVAYDEGAVHLDVIIQQVWFDSHENYTSTGDWVVSKLRVVIFSSEVDWSLLSQQPPTRNGRTWSKRVRIYAIRRFQSFKNHANCLFGPFPNLFLSWCIPGWPVVDSWRHHASGNCYITSLLSTFFTALGPYFNLNYNFAHCGPFILEFIQSRNCNVAILLWSWRHHDLGAWTSPDLVSHTVVTNIYLVGGKNNITYATL